MCLAVPMRIIEIDRYLARCEAKGVEREVSLFMLQDEPLEVGDYVMVHVGYALQKMTPQEAHSAWEVYDELLGLAPAPVTEHDGDTNAEPGADASDGTGERAAQHSAPPQSADAAAPAGPDTSARFAVPLSDPFPGPFRGPFPGPFPGPLAGNAAVDDQGRRAASRAEPAVGAENIDPHA